MLAAEADATGAFGETGVVSGEVEPEDEPIGEED
jgi:hypothetical protein